MAAAVGCRDHATPDAAVTPALASPVPVLPPSPDPAGAMRTLDKQIEVHATEPDLEIELLLQRAALHGRLEDYVAALDGSKRWVEAEPTSAAAWRERAVALTRVHQFAAARGAIEKLKALARDPSEWTGLVATIDEATGDLASSGRYREQQATEFPNATTLTLWAGHLAIEGRTQEALAVMPRAAAAIRDNPASLLHWILFQWGRIYELAGEPAKARDFFFAARARLPTAETTAHLAQAIRATGGDPNDLLSDQTPELLALAGKTDEARREWERYLVAFPEAFADHAARFYLTVDPPRAYALAKLDFANRPTLESRALLLEASLAANAPACDAIAPLTRSLLRPQLFIAWRALNACHQDASVVATQLGIPERPQRPPRTR